MQTDIPVTAAIRVLRQARVDFVPHPYPYAERGGTRHSSRALGVDEHVVIKTIVMETRQDDGRLRPVIVLMHGDREISTKQLARVLGVKTVGPASEAAVEKYTGYMPGGVSPFGTRLAVPVFVEESVLELEHIFINGGKRGFLVRLSPSVLTTLLHATPVQVGYEG